MNIPFLSFRSLNSSYEKDFRKAFDEFLEGGWYVLGQNVKAFEEAYAAFNQVKYCVGVANGLDALILSLRTLGVGPGDEVIVPSNTYIASWLAVSYVGAVPVPVEPDIKTFNIDSLDFLGSACASNHLLTIL